MQIFTQVVAPSTADCKLVVDMANSVWLGWQHQVVCHPGICKQPAVTRCVRAAPLCPVVQVAQLHSQNGSLQRVQAAVGAQYLVLILLPAAVDTQEPQPISMI